MKQIKVTNLHNIKKLFLFLRLLSIAQKEFFTTTSNGILGGGFYSFKELCSVVCCDKLNISNNFLTMQHLFLFFYLLSFSFFFSFVHALCISEHIRRSTIVQS